jgi:hypothetical protein
VAEATELGLPDVAEPLRPLLTQTQDHVIDLPGCPGQVGCPAGLPSVARV